MGHASPVTFAKQETNLFAQKLFSQGTQLMEASKNTLLLKPHMLHGYPKMSLWMLFHQYSALVSLSIRD